MAATLPDLADPAGVDRRPYRGVRTRSATNRAVKSGASLRDETKMGDRFVAKLGRIAYTPIASLMPVGHFGLSAAHVLNVHTAKSMIPRNGEPSPQPGPAFWEDHAPMVISPVYGMRANRRAGRKKKDAPVVRGAFGTCT